MALAVALLWVVHPLNTESVTYVVQRAESLASLFYLLVLYSVIRGMHSERAALWHILAVTACILGMGTKEIVFTAPLVVLLYDRTLVAGSFRQAFEQRGRLYACLACSWAVPIAMAWSSQLVNQPPGEPVPFGVWSYASSQPAVILHYLYLSLSPHPLCLSYEWPAAKTASEIVPPMLGVGLILAATVWGLARRSAAAYLMAWFFLILAPSSSVIPLSQLAFEHRTYLALAGVLTLLVASVYLAVRAMARRGWISSRMQWAGQTVLLVVRDRRVGISHFSTQPGLPKHVVDLAGHADEGSPQSVCLQQLRSRPG